MPADPLLSWRDEFPIVDRTNYLISNSLGAMPRGARARVERFLDLWDRRGVRSWHDEWWELKDTVADRVAGILGGAPGSVTMHQNVATAMQSIVSCFEFDGPRNRIVVTDHDFPSVIYLCEQQVRRGAELVRVPADGPGVDLGRLLEAIDERTLLVAVSHGLFRSSFVQDAEAIAARARRVGAFVILDVFQTVGARPLHLAAWGVHAAVGGALKYCCGGPGNGFLYVDPDEVARLRPSFTGWAAHRDPFAFSIEGQDYRDDGGRFLTGTPNVPALFAGDEGLRIIAEIGVEAIRSKSQRLTQRIVERAEQSGIAVASPRDPARRGGHVTLDVPGGAAVCEALLAEDILVDHRPGAGLRVAPHFYTRAEECDAAVDRIAAIVAAGDKVHRSD